MGIQYNTWIKIVTWMTTFSTNIFQYNERIRRRHPTSVLDTLINVDQGAGDSFTMLSSKYCQNTGMSKATWIPKLSNLFKVYAGESSVELSGNVMFDV